MNPASGVPGALPPRPAVGSGSGSGCNPCAFAAAGLLFCEDGVVAVNPNLLWLLGVGPPPTTGGPWAPAYDPATNAGVWVNVGGVGRAKP